MTRHPPLPSSPSFIRQSFVQSPVHTLPVTTEEDEKKQVSTGSKKFQINRSVSAYPSFPQAMQEQQQIIRQQQQEEMKLKIELQEIKRQQELQFQQEIQRRQQQVIVQQQQQLQQLQQQQQLMIQQQQLQQQQQQQQILLQQQRRQLQLQLLQLIINLSQHIVHYMNEAMVLISINRIAMMLTITITIMITIAVIIIVTALIINRWSYRTWFPHRHLPLNL